MAKAPSRQAPRRDVQSEEANRRRSINVWEIRLLFATAVATAVAAGAAAYSVFIANKTARDTIQFQSELSANETWSSYRDLQMEFEDRFGKFTYPSGDGTKDSQYEKLNERLLMAADLLTFIREIDKDWNDPQWEDSFAFEFRQNRDFFLSKQFLDGSAQVMSTYCTYRAPARRWIVNAFQNESAASSKLRSAEAECQRFCSQRAGCS
jgi:hypothetical protein